ncbi:MAG: portal protein [Dongiaceae bacterium]
MNYSGDQIAPGAKIINPNSDPKIKNLLERFGKAVTRRRNWEDRWQDCYDYSLLQREGFYGETEGEDRTDRIFDETAVVGVQEFASRMQSGFCPAFMRWVKFDAGPGVPIDQRENIAKGLEEIEADFFDVINHSNFNQEIYEALLEIAVGTAAILVEENDEPDRPARFTAVPLTQIWLEKDPFDGIGAVFYAPKMRAGDLLIKWPKAKINNSELSQAIDREPEKEVEVVCVTYRDWSIRSEEVNRLCVIVKQYEDLIYEEEFRGEGSNPWIVGRWSKSAGEVYGRGPLLNAMPAIKTLNLTHQLILENAELAISGMWQGDDDGVLNPDTVRLVPGTVIPKAPGSSGLQPLETPGRFDVGDMIIEKMQHNVRKALYNETLGPREGTPPSATEVSERMADLARQIGSPFGRIMSEIIEPMVRRVLYIRRKQGAIKIPRIGGRYITIRPTAALAKAQRFDDINNERYFYQTIGELYGPEMVALVSKPEEVAARFAELYQVSKNPLRSKIEIKQIMQKLQQAAQQMAGTEQKPT